LAIVTALLPGRQLNYRGKHVLVTGGSEGLGRVIALQLVAAGADVTIVARRAEVLQKVVDEASMSNSPSHGRIFFQTADVTNADAIAKAVAQAVATVGPVDILIPCAGKATMGYSHKHTVEDHRRAMDLNFFGTLNTPEVVAKSILSDLKQGVYNIYCGDFGINLLGVLGAGMSPRKNPALDVLVFPIASIAAWFVRGDWDKHVKVGHDKKHQQ
ncbi:hypothetical protein DYB37_009771, partial [Aphanomyces astaci]